MSVELKLPPLAPSIDTLVNATPLASLIAMAKGLSLAAISPGCEQAIV